MLPSDPATAQLDVSVIVPARNEEASLGACLESLTRQIGVRFEVIVVDDGSTDRTGEIARSFTGVQVIDAGPLPEGWTGKNNAMASGAKIAKGKWLLFTDADTVHSPTSLARGLTEAELRQAQLLSYSPEQELRGFWQKAVMPVIFAELAKTYRPSEVSDPNSPAAAANGQYLLIWREAYDAVGGHAAVNGKLLEDVALARIVKSSGRRIFFRYGKDVVRTRMYRNFTQLCEGWKKNLTLLFPSTRRLALLRLLEFILILASALLVVIEAISGRTNSALLLATVTVVLYALFLARIRRAHFSWRTNALALLGLPLFAYLLQRSELCYKQGAVSWKGRAYSTRLAEQEPERHSATSAHAENAQVSKPLSVLTPAASDRNNPRLTH
ncbi:MAG: glycosyl transferase [Acidobacteria bacterium]|nr:MAG: glycosyl transferase [Acidobacteriota bacterium]